MPMLSLQPTGEIMRSAAVSVLIAAASLASSSGIDAQIVFNSSSGPSRWQLGGDFVISQPKGEFANNIGNGYGMDFTGMFRLDPKGYINIRGDLGGVQYGREHQNIPLFGSGRITLDLETTNQIGFAAIGTQLQIPDGMFRPYANAAIGYTDFTTSSSLSGSDDSFEAIHTTNAHDGSHAYIFGGGVMIPFGNRFSSGALNLGARYFYGGHATYLKKGDIVDNPDGTVTLFPRNSKTDLVLWQLGVSFVLPRPTRQ